MIVGSSKRKTNYIKRITKNVNNIQSDRPTKKKKKKRSHIFLTEIHKSNSSLFFFFPGYEVDSVHEKM